MTLRAAIDVLAMLACSIYSTIPLFWLVVHPFIARWRNARPQRLPADSADLDRVHRRNLSHPVAIPLGALLRQLVELDSGTRHVLMGFSIYAQAFKSFPHEQVSGLAELEPDRHRQELVTTGIRSRVRHPIYLGHLCEILGWCIGTGLTALYVLAGLAIVTGIS